MLKGTLFALLGFFFLAVFGVTTKMACQGENKIVVSFLTYFLALALLTPCALKIGFTPLDTRLKGLTFCRAFFGLMASVLYMQSLDMLSVANASLLYSTAPLFIPFLAMGWMKNRITVRTWVAVVIGFIGITCIIRPDLSFSHQSGTFVGLTAGFFLAVALLFLKRLTQVQNILMVIFYFALLGTLFQIPLALYCWKAPSFSSVLILLVCALSFIVSQYCIAVAYRYAPVTKVGVFQYSAIVFAGFFDWAIWQHVPNLPDLLGAALVIFAGTLVIRQGN